MLQETVRVEVKRDWSWKFCSLELEQWKLTHSFIYINTRREWLNGMAHGKGVETFPDGSIRHDGLWVEDEPVMS